MKRIRKRGRQAHTGTGSRKAVIRVGIDAHMLGDRSGGNETYYSGIINALDPPEDMEIIILVPRSFSGSFKNGLKTVRFRHDNVLLRYLLDIPHIVRSYGLDIIHTQYFLPPFTSPAKRIVTIADICFMHLSGIFSLKDLIPQKLLIPVAAKRSDRVVTVSYYSRNDIAGTFHVSPEKIDVTYDAPTAVIPDDSAEEMVDGPYLLTIGNIQPRKNLVRLFRAFRSFRKRTRWEGKLVVIGKKDYNAERIMSKAGNGIIFTGYVSNETRESLIRNACAFIYPSLFEGFGLPPVEAMIRGIPTAVSNVTSLPEVVGDGALLFDPLSVPGISDSIEKLITDGELRKSLSEKGRIAASRFSWEQSAEKLVEIYRRTYEND